MVNILIIDDNMHYSKNLINFLFQRNPVIRLISMITDGKEAIKYLSNKNNTTDIILLDMNLPYFSGSEILKFLDNNNLEQYTDSVIAISGEINYIPYLRNNKYIYTFINKLQGFEKILEEINNLSDRKQLETMNKKNVILKELNLLKFNEKFVGTKYLLEAITIIMENYKYREYNLNRDIYPIIANKYNKTVNNIKCNINNATTIMNCDCEKNILMKYFTFYNINSEAKPKQVIDAIIKKVSI